MTTQLVVVFDIDGTLTRSSGLDDRSFERTALEVLGLSSISLDWSAYPHSTDDAIAAHLGFLAHGRAAARAEIDAFEQHYLRVLREELVSIGCIEPVSGAREIFAAVSAAGWTPAVATGCWRRSALCKLEAAKLTLAAPGGATCGAAFADDAWPRERIIALAVARTLALGAGITPRRSASSAGSLSSVDAQGAAASAQSAAHVVYVGDGTWDVRACRRGGYRFVGIAEGQRAEALRQEGAGTVLAGYSDQRAFLGALENAQVPGSA